MKFHGIKHKLSNLGVHLGNKLLDGNTLLLSLSSSIFQIKKNKVELGFNRHCRWIRGILRGVLTTEPKAPHLKVLPEQCHQN